MNVRRFAPVVLLVAVPFALLAAACGEDGDPSSRALRSAGGLSESRLPKGIRAESPAPTGANSADKSLEAGWYKNAKPGEKLPTAGDRPSM